MKTVAAHHHAALADRAVRSLRENGFDAAWVATAAEAGAKVLSLAREGATVGFGGSMTVASLGLKEELGRRGAVLLDHNAPGLSPAEKREVQRRQLTCDLFLSSANAVTLDGAIVNVDGNGNRVAALSFGPAKTVVVAGVNKLVRDVEEAWDRIETHAGPMNARRLGKPTPCVKAGTCQDCDAEARICRVYQVLRRRPSLSDFTVLLVGEPLGY
ncbi:MAG TPA: lactate utilization protein [Anaeromyxobacteraceae bacterium]|nr:lactate utilization protein [Anaeromyxobacteraceae bacterium]